MIKKILTKRGFSTLELMIAFALISIVLVGAVGGNFIAQYWTITSQTANEGLYRAKTKIEDLRADIKSDFYSAISSPLTKDTSDPTCSAGGLCFWNQTTVSDISSCSKFVNAYVEWQVDSYPKTSTSLATSLTNTTEVIARGGDCILNTPNGDWKNNTPQSVGFINTSKQFTGIDVLHKYIYATSKISPSFTVYKVPTGVGTNPVQVGTFDIKVGGISVGANALDVEEDLSTGRTYAFIAVNSTTKQLAVLDVTDAANPSLVTQTDLLGNVDPLGSYPQGFRVFIYDGRLYFTTRDTSGFELHIFDITTPTIPIEIGNGVELTRTVEDIVVRKQKVGGVTKKIAYLAADVDSNEVTMFDVTNDVITPLTGIDLAGTPDGQSLYLNGNKLFIGRLKNSSGPEMYAYDISTPTSPVFLGQAEVNDDVLTIKAVGDYVFIGTPIGIQVWSSDTSTWGSGKLQSYAMPNLAPLGFDIDGDWIYAISSAVSDKVQVLYTP